MDQWLSPNSLLTPGIAGGVILLICNTLWAQFALPPKYTGLAASALFGVVVVYTIKANLFIRVVYWILNSLIVFSVATGGTTVAGATFAAGDQAQTERVVYEMGELVESASDEYSTLRERYIELAELYEEATDEQPPWDRGPTDPYHPAPYLVPPGWVGTMAPPTEDRSFFDDWF